MPLPSLACLLLLLGAAPAGAGSAVPDTAYKRAVDLVERLYLEPERVVPDRLLAAAADNLASDVHWLMAASEGNTVTLTHGSGQPVGTVTVASMDDLPRALRTLEDLVVSSGHPVDPDLDVRLSVLDGMTDALDRNTRILAGDQRWRFSLRLKGEYVGIGATFHRELGGLVVADLQDGEPADHAGLELDDLVLRIDGHSTVNMPEDEATRLIEGREGTEVALTVRRAGSGREVTLQVTRARVVEPNVRWRVLEGDVGYIAITHISQRTVYNLRKKLERLRAKSALGRGLVIDLRGNTGGSMQEAALSADLFVDDGLLLRTDGPDGGRVQNLEREMRAAPARAGRRVDVPIVLVVDDRTASGSEILAGALLELQRAAIVGTRTYGKGTVQKLYNLGDDDSVQLKLTVAQYVLANERRIAGEGLIPDVVVGDVRLTDDGVRFENFSEAHQHTPWARIVPALHEEQGWRGKEVDDVDLPLELARQAVLGAAGTARVDVLSSLQQVAMRAHDEQLEGLAEALEARGIDWTGADQEGLFIDAEVRVQATRATDASDRYDVRVEVDNLGDEPLHRALVELDCYTFSPWSGLVVPVGLVPPGGHGVGQVSVSLRPGVAPREDVVAVRLRGDRVAPLQVGDQVLRASSMDVPRVAVEARLVPHADGEMRAEVTLENLADHLITDLEVSFGYPGDLPVELLDPAALVPVLPARGTQRVDLAMRVDPTAPPVLGLEILVRSERFDALARWPLALPRDASVVTLQAPVIEARGATLSAPVGPFTLPVEVTDEEALDHVVVYANGEKLVWVPGGKARASLDAQLTLRPGVNRVVVVAEDDEGVDARATFAIRGVAPTPHPPVVDASE